MEFDMFSHSKGQAEEVNWNNAIQEAEYTVLHMKWKIMLKESCGIW